MFALLGEDGAFQDVQYFPARGGFSVSWYQGLVVTLHNHPGTDMFYHQPMLVAVKNHKLLIEPTEPGWPAKHADN